MSVPDDDPVSKKASEIADGASADFGDLERSGAVTPSKLRALRTLAAIRQSQEGEMPQEEGFRILGLINEGSFGRVYKAVDLKLGRTVAIKVLQPKSPITAQAREAFVEEARILARLDHANILRVYQVDDRGGDVRLVLEYVDGETLDRILEKSGPLSAEEAARIGSDLCRALAAIHGQGLVHRDLKPANVMRAAGGRTVLLDFGLAHFADPLDASQGSPGGTPRVMAPEQLAGRPVGPAADLYALGVVLYRIATGSYPADAKDLVELRKQVLDGRLVPILDRRPDLPAPFAEIIERALRPRPEDRFASAGEMERALRAFLGGESARNASSRRSPWWTLGALALFVAASVALYFTALHRAADARDLGFDARIFTLRDGKEERLRSGDPIRLRDQLYCEVSLRRPAYVYVFDEDDAGSFFCVFPLEGDGWERTNPVPAGAALRLPGKHRSAERYWTIDTAGGGAERFLVVASMEPIPEVEAMRNRAARPRVDGEAADVARMAVRLDQPEGERMLRGVLRGAGAVRGAGTVDAASAPSTAPVGTHARSLLLELFGSLQERWTGTGSTFDFRLVQLKNP